MTKPSRSHKSRTGASAPGAPVALPRYARAKRVCELFDISASTLWSWIKCRPEFPQPIHAGANTTLHDVAAIERWLRSNIEVSACSRADKRLEQRIKFLSSKIEAAMARWEASRCAEDRADAESALKLRDAAVKARSAAQVARLEQERGLL